MTVRYARGEPWSEDEWTVAWDACPKDSQRYGPSDRNVREVALLLNRTPSAVSHSFGNLWSAWTHGRVGLGNYSHECEVVVNRYRNRMGRLHTDALRLRRDLTQSSLAPRIEIHEEGSGRGLLDPSDAWGISSETGVSRTAFVIYSRRGSIIDGLVTNLPYLFWVFGPALGERFVRYVETHLGVRQDSSKPTPEIQRSQSWVAAANGRWDLVESQIITHYLPSADPDRLSAQNRTRLAGFLSELLGVRVITVATAVSPRAQPHRVSRTRLRQIRSQTCADVSALSAAAQTELDELLEVVRTGPFVRSHRQLRTRVRRLERQRRLDEFN